MKRLAMAAALAAGLAAQAYEYDVREPAIRPQCSGAQPGVWTLDWNAALANAKAEGKYTLVLFTGSWWCPYCHTIEDLVLTSDAWRTFVSDNGFYLAELDYSYRYAVPEGQEWKSYHPEMPEGWGFKCWYMNPGFLAANGLTEEEGLRAIQAEYVYQGEMSLPDAAQFTMKTWDGASEITYGRIAYACIVVIGPDGREVGRVDFPWHSTTKVTAEEAQAFEIGSIEKLLDDECALCGEPVAGAPDTSARQTYRGWLLDAAGGVVGSAEFKTTRADAQGVCRVSGAITARGRTTRFKAVPVDSFRDAVEFQSADAAASVRFGSTGIDGTATGAFGACTVRGGRDVFKAHDAEALARRKDVAAGTWSLVVRSDDATASPFARGYGTLSAAVDRNGGATIRGTLGDGTKVSARSRAIVGENGVSCVPFRADLYGKKGGLGFVMWFKEGRLIRVMDRSQWVADGRNGAFATGFGVLNTPLPGVGEPESEMDFMLAGFDEEVEIKGRKVVVDPSLDTVAVDGRRWRGTADTLFRATANAKSGALAGSMTFFTGDADRPRRVVGSFAGILMGGSGYGTVVVRGVGSWAAKIAPCGGCSD